MCELRRAVALRRRVAVVVEPVGAAALAAMWPGIEEAVSPQIALGCGVPLAAVLLALWRPSESTDH